MRRDAPPRQPSPWDTAETVTKAEADQYEQHYRPEDMAAFEEITSGLPLKVMYGLGPHSLPIIEEVLNRVAPRRVLEIGFGAGASASMFLAFSHCELVSIEMNVDPRVVNAAQLVGRTYPGRFELVSGRSEDFLGTGARVDRGGGFDLIFIDGDHSLAGVRTDIRIGLEHEIPWFLFDDWWPHYGPGVQPAVRDVPALVAEQQWGNLMLMSLSRHRHPSHLSHGDGGPI